MKWSIARYWRQTRYLFVGFLAVILAFKAYGGSIGFTSISSFMDWEPECYKPDQPSLYVGDAYSFNLAVDEYNSYVQEVKMYLSCLQSEADSDLKLVARAISNGLDEKRSEILSEVESAKSELEMQRLIVH